MQKRFLDLFISIPLFILVLPVLIIFVAIVYFSDFYNPLYIPERVGRNGKMFRMYKIRSMIQNADKSGVDSTSNNDTRITTIGLLIRKFKIDELTQLINVIKGDMSLVGPRPNIKSETDLYTVEELTLLNIRPGITDFSSIVFSDEGQILSNHPDPDIGYNQLIRPGKGALGVFYVKNHTVIIDLKLIFLTALSIFTRERALKIIASTLKRLDAPEDLIKLSLRKEPLRPKPPLGSTEIVTSRILKQHSTPVI